MLSLKYHGPDAYLCRSIQLTQPNPKPANCTVSSTRGKKVLIIDDDQILCLGLKIRLKANYYDLCFAHDGESALCAVLTEKPDLIILDIGLPRGDGYYVMESLNAVPDFADVPVIVLTARDGLTHERRCRDAGAKRFFEKPVNSLRLLTAIRQLVE
jgi:two-component system, OmpR family, KDP operon response regulator KdpE